MTMNFVGKFWGPEEILDVTDTGLTTHRGVGIFEVTTRRQETSDKTRKYTVTEKGLALVVSDEPKDWNYPQDMKLAQVVRDLMAVATDYGIFGSELQPMLARFGMALATRFEHAAHIRFEGDDSEFVPGGNEFHTWSMAKAENIIATSKDNAPTETNS